MANCPINKIDSNVATLAYAKEECLGVLPDAVVGSGDQAGAVWQELDPNSYADFSATYTSTARNPINASRQNQKGVITDVDVTAGINQDLTLANTTDLMQSFFFALQRSRPNTHALNKVAVPTTAVTVADGYAIAGAAALGFAAGQIVLAHGYASPANNGVKTITEATSSLVKVGGILTAEASPPASASLQTVGFAFTAGDASIITPVGDLPRLTLAAGDLAPLNLLPGEWIYLGADQASNRFTNNQGFCRVNRVEGRSILFDKVDWAPVAEAGTGKTITIFFGDIIKNEKDPTKIVRTSLQLRRTLGRDANGVQSEYMVGCVANELTVNLAQADKVNLDMSFVGIRQEFKNGSEGLKPGATLPLPAGAEAFNTTSDLARIKLALVSEVNGNVAPLFSFATEGTITISNGVTANKALGVLGGFDASTGNFEVGGSVTSYFTTVDAVEAVRDNASATLDVVMVKANQGIVWDIPLLTLGGGNIQVEQDAPIMVPLEPMGAESSFGHTLQYQSFTYLPSSASNGNI